MAKRKKRGKSAGPYMRRLVEDRYVQDQLRNAAGRLRQVYRRASRQRGRAAEDKRLYGDLREAATSVRKAVLALQRRRPEPQRRGRKVALAALAGGGAAMVVRGRLRKRRADELPADIEPAEAGEGAPAEVAPAAPGSSEQSEPATPTTG